MPCLLLAAVGSRVTHYARLMGESEPVPYEEAKAFAEEHGYEYLGPLTAPSLPDDPLHTRCGRCGRISAERLGDISFGCSTCKPRD